MQINVTFDSLDDMRAFVENIFTTGEAPKPIGRAAKQQAQAAQPAPTVQPALQVAPVSQPVPAAPAMPQTQPPSQPVATTTPVQAPVSAPAPQPVPTAAQSYTLDELAKAAMTLMDTGRQAELQSLLASFGVEALPVLPKEQYGAFATALRGMGAQI